MSRARSVQKRVPYTSRCRGVTVVELITLLVTVMILAAIAIPGMSPVVLRSRVRGAAWQLAGDLRLARQQAVGTRKRFRVCVTRCAIPVPAGTYSVERDEGTISSPRWVSLTGAATQLPENVTLTANNTPVFQADGTGSPMCTFTLRNLLGQYKVVVASTGRVRICEGSC